MLSNKCPFYIPWKYSHSIDFTFILRLILNHVQYNIRFYYNLIKYHFLTQLHKKNLFKQKKIVGYVNLFCNCCRCFYVDAVITVVCCWLLALIIYVSVCSLFEKNILWFFIIIVIFFGAQLIFFIIFAFQIFFFACK